MSNISFWNFNTINTVYADCPYSLLEEIKHYCDFYENLFSRFRPESDIWRVNHSCGKSVKVSQETAELIKRSIDYSRMSQGYFDISIGSVSSLWDFSGEDLCIPNEETVKEALRNVGYEGIKIDGNCVCIPNGTVLDLGGIAKGYIADNIARVLKTNNCKSALINLGGNIVLIGRNKLGKPWKVGIQIPESDSDEYSTVIEAEDISLVTSGVYERGYKTSNGWVHHILDTHTGYPADTDIVSVTIICSDSAKADAFSTACLAMGNEKALRFIESQKEIKAYLQLMDGSTCFV